MKPRPVYVSAVVYAFEAEHTITDFLNELDETLTNDFEGSQIVVVVDHSGDLSYEKAKAAVEALKSPASVIELSRFHGLESGIIPALERANGDFVFEFETSDLDVPITELLTTLYETASRGFDVVGATTGKVRRRERTFYRIVNHYSDLDLDPETEVVRIVSRRALNMMLDFNEKVRFRKALYKYAGFRSTTIIFPSLHKPHQMRKRARETTKTALDILISFSDLGLRFAHLMSILFLFLSAAAGAYAVYINVARDDIEPGWTTIVLFLSAAFTGVFFILGLIGEYVARILIEVRARPIYSVSQTYEHGPNYGS